MKKHTHAQREKTIVRRRGAMAKHTEKKKENSGSYKQYADPG